MIETQRRPEFEHSPMENAGTNRIADTTPSSSSVAGLLSGILDDAQTLIRQQAVMLRAEIREDGRKTLLVAQYMSIGAVFASLGALFLMIATVYLLQWLAPTLHLSACWAIIGTILLIGGIVALAVGRNKLKAYNPLPDKTLNTLEENLTWKTTTPRT